MQTLKSEIPYLLHKQFAKTTNAVCQSLPLNINNVSYKGHNDHDIVLEN